MVGDRHVGTLLRIVEPLVAGPAGVEAPCPSHGTAPRMPALGYEVGVGNHVHGTGARDTEIGCSAGAS